MIAQRHHLLPTLAAALCLLFTAFGFTPANAVEVVGVTDEVIDIERGKARLVRLDRPANTVFVANPGVADVQIKSERLIYVFGASVGETTLFAVDGRDNVVASVTIRVNHNLTRIRQALSALVPANGVDIHSIDGSLVLEGEVGDPELAAEIQQLAARFVPEGDALINRLEVTAPTQINLRVRVAEVSRSAVKILGVNWESIASFGNFVVGLATGVDFISDAGAIIRPTEEIDNVVVDFAAGGTGIGALLDALADEGLLTVLAEPNLTAVSGENASFLAGGEFPIPVPDGDGGFGIEFKEFGVQLDFTPVLLSNNRISLRVRPEVSQLSAAGAIELQGFAIPALTTRRAETTVELASGQSFAIGGLIQNNVLHDVSKFPGLGDLPVVGQLFRSDRFQRDESELVILVTPYLVRPVNGDRLRSPAEDYIPPTDLERILWGQNYNDEMVSPPGTEPRLRGQAGFMVE